MRIYGPALRRRESELFWQRMTELAALSDGGLRSFEWPEPRSKELPEVKRYRLAWSAAGTREQCLRRLSRQWGNAHWMAS